tara:strand:+ start:1038 stop:1325 length:288 start_codon:yes stop_codon:yes gene_type:complete
MPVRGTDILLQTEEEKLIEHKQISRKVESEFTEAQYAIYDDKERHYHAIIYKANVETILLEKERIATESIFKARKQLQEVETARKILNLIGEKNG